MNSKIYRISYPKEVIINYEEKYERNTIKLDSKNKEAIKI